MSTSAFFTPEQTQVSFFLSFSDSLYLDAES